MEYFLIIVLQLLGIGFHVMQKIISMGDNHPEKTRGQIFDTFFREDWDTLMVSALVLFTDLTIHFIMNYYDPHLMNTSFAFPALWGFTISYRAVSFIIALFLGYAGQRVAYKLFGTAEKLLNKKIENKLQ
jgi:hypothetical protein